MIDKKNNTIYFGYDDIGLGWFSNGILINELVVPKPSGYNIDFYAGRKRLLIEIVPEEFITFSRLIKRAYVDEPVFKFGEYIFNFEKASGETMRRIMNKLDTPLYIFTPPFVC